MSTQAFILFFYIITVLVKDGPEALEYYLSARAFSQRSEGVHYYEDYAPGTFQYFFQPELYNKKVYSTGWHYLDPFYRVAMGEVTIITGIVYVILLFIFSFLFFIIYFFLFVFYYLLFIVGLSICFFFFFEIFS